MKDCQAYWIIISISYFVNYIFTNKLAYIYIQIYIYELTWYAINIFNYLFSFQGSGLDGWKVQCIELDLVSFKLETIVTNTHLICFLLYISTNYHRRKINAPIRTKLLILRQVKHFVGCISLLHKLQHFNWRSYTITLSTLGEGPNRTQK